MVSAHSSSRRPTARATPARDRLTFAGHATVLIELSGTSLLTDPALGRWVGPLRRTVPRVGLARPVDWALVSHMHRDHLDLPSLRKLGAVGLVVPKGAGAIARRAGAREVLELEPGERVELGGVGVLAVPAAHDPHRDPAPGSPAAQPLGYVLSSGRRSVYFAGDTQLFGAMSRLGEVDVALLPIWGWGRSVGEGHLDPAGAAEAAALIRPRLAVPIHWGTLAPPLLGRLWRGSRTEPAEEFVRLAGERAPDVEVRVLEPGEALELDPGEGG